MLYLDDFRNPVDSYHMFKDTIYLREGWDVVRNYEEFVVYIKENGIPDLISFDHDLADEHYVPQEYWDHYEDSKSCQEERYPDYKEKTGYDCLNFLLEILMENRKELPLPKILFHTANPVGRDNMKKSVMSFNRKLNLMKRRDEDLNMGDEDIYPEDMMFI